MGRRKKKYSKNFERDFNFFIKNRRNFSFTGGLENKSNHKVMLMQKKGELFDSNGISAKEAFFMLDSQGKTEKTKHPLLLISLLNAKAGINFQINQWALALAEGTMLPWELNGNMQALEWKYDGSTYKPVYHKNIKEQYGLPDWVIKAIWKQYKFAKEERTEKLKEIERREKRKKLDKLVTKKSDWINKAEWRKRNRWWLKPWQRVQLKYHKIKREIKEFLFFVLK